MVVYPCVNLLPGWLELLRVNRQLEAEPKSKSHAPSREAPTVTSRHDSLEKVDESLLSLLVTCPDSGAMTNFGLERFLALRKAAHVSKEDCESSNNGYCEEGGKRVLESAAIGGLVGVAKGCGKSDTCIHSC